MAIAKKSTTPKKPVKAAAAEKAPAKKPAAKKTTPAPKAAAKKAEAPAKAVKATKKAAAPAPEPVPTPAPVAEAPVKKKAAGRKAETGSGLPVHGEALLAALREGRPVELIFADADANAPRTFEPRQLTFDTLSQAWFVFGWDRRYNAERHHRVDLLAEVNDVEGVGRAAQGPFPDGTPGNQIGGWLGGEAIAVKVLLHKQWVFAVKQAPPAFPQFQMKEQEDGKALVTFTATDLRAIARWAMQFGDGITVQEPQRLLDRLRQVASAWAGKDLSRPAAPAPAPTPAPRREEREERPRREEREDRPRREAREDHPRREESKGGSKVEIRIERL